MMRVGNKKPAMTVKTSRDVGKPSKTEDANAHTTNGNKTVSGGQSIYGMPLMSAAAAKVK
jgi:hypothetical protein